MPTITEQSAVTKKQVRFFGPKPIAGYGHGALIKAVVRYDDDCGNGHNSFAITGSIHTGGRWDSGGCVHEEIAQVFPELAPFIKWHLCSSEGPMHYLANVLHFAGDRDCWGLRKDETRQIRNGKSGKPAWILESTAELPKYVDSDEQPTGTATLRYVPWNRIGEGKARELDAARRAAIWPDATDEELTAPDLKERLEARLPKLLEEFRAAVELLGFVW